MNTIKRPAPTLTPEQRRAATEKGMAARIERARLKIALANGEIGLCDLMKLVKTDPAVGRMKVDEMLRAHRGIGSVRATRIMQECRISPTRRLAGLGPGQLERLYAVLDSRSTRHGS